MEWQKKESAPRDGTRFIAWDVIYGYTPWVYREDDEWVSEAFTWSGHFSHWMPVPSKPNE